ncbi:hypothetical protein J132_05511 [Termitomyces sp. J132]|nr:hypothetical protein C0989_004652 [Termitomyces sp. Mn162]KNZ77406.1 hypothetical protein J132_05511 [Termitomyces sp. J132]
MDQAPSPKAVQNLEKELAKEAKIEASRVKDLLDDLAKTEKARTKAEKAVHKAESASAKAGKKEVKAVEAANKAAHKHDIAMANLRNAEQDEQLKKRQDAKLLQEMEVKKVKAEAALRDQETHTEARGAKLAELKETDARPAADANFEQKQPSTTAVT